MIHLNGNILCVFDCETTGTDPYKHDIWQICCMPLDFKLKSTGTPFEVLLKPRNVENRDPSAITKKNFNRALLTGMDYEIASSLFIEWVERLNLGFKKRIVPLAHNWPFDRGFIIEWLGQETVDFYMDSRYRDTMVISSFIADVCDHNAERVPFPKVNLRAVCRNLGVEWDDGSAHDAVYDAFKTAEVYRKLIKNSSYIAEEI
jgi:DNA polymerase III epsilon subunit-like protein